MPNDFGTFRKVKRFEIYEDHNAIRDEFFNLVK